MLLNALGGGRIPTKQCISHSLTPYRGRVTYTLPFRNEISTFQEQKIQQKLILITDKMHSSVEEYVVKLAKKFDIINI